MNINKNKKIAKVLIIIPGMKFGGMERVSFIMREILLKKGFDVELLTLFNNDSDYKPNFSYHSLNCEISQSKFGKVLVSIKRVMKLRQYKRHHPCDLAISFGQNANFTNIFSRNNEKILLGIRSYDWLYSYFFNYKLEKYIYLKADHVVSVSKKIQSEAEKIFSIDKEKSDFLYNPYNIHYINSRASEKITEIELNNKKRKLVSVGRLEDQKGFYHLIKAFSLLKNRDDYMLYIIGNGSKKNILQNMINNFNLENNILLLGGNENPYKFMKYADAYVMSSITEGFPNVLVEAMAVGTPIISSDCLSGPREILSDGDIDLRVKTLEKSNYGIIVNEMTDSKLYNTEIEKCDIELCAGIEEMFTNDNFKKYSMLSKNRSEKFSYNVFEEKLLDIIKKMEQKN